MNLNGSEWIWAGSEVDLGWIWMDLGWIWDGSGVDLGWIWGGSKKGRRLKVTDEAVATIRRMAAQGASKAAMVRATDLSHPTVYTILAEER